MKDLEKYINEHREEFDLEEPPFDHFEKFETKLRGQKHHHFVRDSRTTMLRIAALILIMITVSVFVFDLATREFRERFGNNKTTSDLPVDVQDAILYYDHQVSVCMTKIQKLSGNSKEAGKLSADALKEIQRLDGNTEEIKQLLSQNPHDERMMSAILQNQKMKEGIMNNILDQLTKKEK